MAEKNVIDICCGSRMFYFNKNDENVVFCDKRKLDDVLCDGRRLEINPDMICDFRNLPFDDNSFDLVIFDPPHLVKVGENSWLAKKYGKLSNNWKQDLRKGFEEAFRILREGGTLVFKWNETDIRTSEIIKLAPQEPLIGHKSGKRSNTQWLVFYKERKGAYITTDKSKVEEKLKELNNA